MQKPYQEVATVGDLLSYLKDVPMDTPIGRLTHGHYPVNRIGDVGVFLGELPVGSAGQEELMTILRISA